MGRCVGAAIKAPDLLGCRRGERRRNLIAIFGCRLHRYPVIFIWRGERCVSPLAKENADVSCDSPTRKDPCCFIKQTASGGRHEGFSLVVYFVIIRYLILDVELESLSTVTSDE